MNTKRSVALIEPVGGHGGMDYYDLGLCRGLVKAGWQVTWYTCIETRPPHVEGVAFRPAYKGVWGKASRWVRAARYALASVSAVSEAARLRQRICHLHFFHGAPEELLLLRIAKLFRRRIVVTVHDVESFAHTATSSSEHVRKIYKLADRFIVHNLVSKDDLSKSLHVPVNKITVIPHGNYIASIHDVPSSNSAKEKFGIEATSKVVLFFGQIKDVKGLDLLIEAMPTVAYSVPEVTLLIAGRPWKSDFQSYQAIIDRLDIELRCKLHIRYIPDNEVAEFYAAADVVVLPYRRIYQSGVVLLAMSYGKAVLVSDLPGMTELVMNDVNGYVFSLHAPGNLAESLIRVLKDDNMRARISEAGFEHVRSHYDWDDIGSKTASLYDSLLVGQ